MSGRRPTVGWHGQLTGKIGTTDEMMVKMAKDVR